MAGPRTNQTAVTHPQVAEYLRQLEAALRMVPAARASELREQIAAHLDDALPPGATDEEVTRVLKELGRPSDLAAEAVATAGKRPWPARVGWRAWTAVTAVVLVLAAVASYLAVMLSAAPLSAAGDNGWWYKQDGSRAVRSTADGVNQTAVPIRPGHQQGFLIMLYNPSGQTQTVVGVTGYGGSLGCSTMHIGVSPDDWIRFPGQPPLPGPHQMRYRLPGVIGPHRQQLMRVLWTSRANCLDQGSDLAMDHIALQVRVGLLTRTENIQLTEAFDLSGRSSARHATPGAAHGPVSRQPHSHGASPGDGVPPPA